MALAYRVLQVIFLASMTTHGSPIPPISRKPSSSHIAQLPQFLSVHQLVEVEEGSTAELECRLINLGSEHTVSSEAVSVYISLFPGILAQVFRHVSADSGRTGV